jgi:malic enzyme
MVGRYSCLWSAGCGICSTSRSSTTTSTAPDILTRGDVAAMAADAIVFALAGVVSPAELGPHYIIPSVFHPDVASAVVAAVRDAAGGRPSRS